MNFILRPWHADDADDLVRYADNPEIAKNLRDAFPHPYTMENAVSFIGMASKSPSIFAIEIEGHACGGIGLHPQQDIYRLNAEMGYWLGQPFWGHGIITEAIARMVEFGFAHLPVDRIFAIPFGSNTASQRVLEKNGFVLEAHLYHTIIKNGKLEDELIYAVRRK